VVIYCHTLEKGRIHFNEIVELGDIISGRVKSRTDDSELTIFESQWYGHTRYYCARYIYEKSLELKAYEKLPFK